MGASVQIQRDNTADILKRLKSRSVVAGLPSDSAPYPNGQSVVQVGVDHEFGSENARTYTSPRGNKVSVSGVPERSFMRSTAKENRARWAKIIKSSVGNMIKGDFGTSELMARIGSVMSSDIKQKIIKIKNPANSPQVIADKGSNNPLIDTGHMKNQITYAVKDGDK